MERREILLRSVVVLSMVGFLFACSIRKVTNGSVYCSTTCSISERQPFKIDRNGSTYPNPCEGKAVTTPYFYDGDMVCKPTIVGTTKFIVTTAPEK